MKNIVVDDGLHTKIKVKAALAGKSMGEIVAQAFEESEKKKDEQQQ